MWNNFLICPFFSLPGLLYSILRNVLWTTSSAHPCTKVKKRSLIFCPMIIDPFRDGQVSLLLPPFPLHPSGYKTLFFPDLWLECFCYCYPGLKYGFTRSLIPTHTYNKHTHPQSDSSLHMWSLVSESVAETQVSAQVRNMPDVSVHKSVKYL